MRVKVQERAFKNKASTLAFGAAAFGLQASFTTLSKLDMIANGTSTLEFKATLVSRGAAIFKLRIFNYDKS